MNCIQKKDNKIFFVQIVSILDTIPEAKIPRDSEGVAMLGDDGKDLETLSGHVPVEAPSSQCSSFFHTSLG